MVYKDILKNAIRSFEDLEKWLAGQKVRVDPRLKDVIARYSDGISEDKKGGTVTSAIGLGKVYVNDPIERVEGKKTKNRW